MNMNNKKHAKVGIGEPRSPQCYTYIRNYRHIRNIGNGWDTVLGGVHQLVSNTKWADLTHICAQHYTGALLFIIVLRLFSQCLRLLTNLDNRFLNFYFINAWPAIPYPLQENAYPFLLISSFVFDSNFCNIKYKAEKGQ